MKYVTRSRVSKSETETKSKNIKRKLCRLRHSKSLIIPWDIIENSRKRLHYFKGRFVKQNANTISVKFDDYGTIEKLAFKYIDNIVVRTTKNKRRFFSKQSQQNYQKWKKINCQLNEKNNSQTNLSFFSRLNQKFSYLKKCIRYMKKLI
jgi:hypothetical protein